MGLVKRALIFSIFLFCEFNVSSTATAQCLEDALRPFWHARGFGSSALALAYNNTAIANDPYAISANPANLGLVQTTNAFLSFQYGLFNQYGKLEDNKDIPKEDKYFRYDGLGFIYPVPVYKGSLVFGLAYVPSIQYNHNLKSEGMVSAIVNSETFGVFLKHNINELGTLYSFRLGSSVEFKKNLFLGLSLNVYNGYREYKYTGIDIDTTDAFDYTTYIRKESIKPDYNGWNINFGALYSSQRFKFGVRISTPLKLKVHEESRFDWLESRDDPPDTNGIDLYDIDYKTTFPLEFASSLAFTFYDITIAFDFATRDWGGINFESNLYTDTTFTEKIDPGINDNIRLNLRTTTDFGIGLIIPLNEKLTAKLGYRIIPRPYYDLPDDEKRITLLGFGMEGFFENQIIVGISYQLLMGRQSTYNEYFETTTSQRFQEHQFTISTSILL